MANRPIEATRVLNCTAPTTGGMSIWGPRTAYMENWNESLQAEGNTKTEAIMNLGAKVDQYMDDQSKEMPLFYAMTSGCSLGTIEVKQKLTVWDSLNRFFMRLGD